MNDRIKELAGHAKFMAEETINKKISKNAELDAFAEKFAQLIVKECAGKVDWILAEGGKTQGDLIKEHFGVEE